MVVLPEGEEAGAETVMSDEEAMGCEDLCGPLRAQIFDIQRGGGAM